MLRIIERCSNSYPPMLLESFGYKQLLYGMEEVIGSIPQASEGQKGKELECVARIHRANVDLGIASSLITKCTFRTLHSPQPFSNIKGNSGAS